MNVSSRFVRAGLIIAWLLFGAMSAAANDSPLTMGLQPRVITYAQGTPITSGVWDEIDTYVTHVTCGGRIVPALGVAWLDPRGPVYNQVPSDASQNLISNAYGAANGWFYSQGIEELAPGSLVVRTYDVQGTPARVGAEFHLEYVGAPIANAHWIQVITTNHPRPGGHGPVRTYIDNQASPRQRLPYYDDGYSAMATEFYDFPGRTDTARSHFWNAELMLVTGPAVPALPGDNPVPGEITYLASVGWGWRNEVFSPNPIAEALPRWGRTRHSPGATADYDAVAKTLSFQDYQINDLFDSRYDGDLWLGATVSIAPLTLDETWTEAGYLFSNQNGSVLVQKDGQTLLTAEMDYAMVYEDALADFGSNFWGFLQNVQVNTDLGSLFAADYQAALLANPDFPPELFGIFPSGIAAATSGFQQSAQFEFDGLYGGQCQVPEPATLALLVLAGLTLLLYGRPRESKTRPCVDKPLKPTW